ncbi:7-cyano-7-deazaguanine synthase [Bacteroides finegoldii]|uniref:7-cyano-7-deazaguanine synthase n=1 Tax=Bacteroides finegoldii TaxID=338188 RepID=UPI0018A98E15|nr:7-cyano-7-deazaguanine synthase [Bacteroides finegoldii]
MNREAALVVFSGGQDSTTCLFWAKRNFKKVYALSFLYGQKHQKEVEFAREIARKAEVEFDVMDVSFVGQLGHNSLTCYNGVQGDGCGHCPACKLRREGLEKYLKSKNQ